IPLFLQLIASAIISGLCFIFQKPSFGTNRLLHLLHLYLCFLLDLLYRNPAFTMSAEFLQKIHFTVISITSEISEMNLYINMPKIKLYLSSIISQFELQSTYSKVGLQES